MTAGTQAARWGGRRWILPGLVTFYVAMRVYHGTFVCMDGDEIFSVGVAEHSWKGLLAALGADSIHPPLFYVLLKLWIGLGNDSLFWVRLLPTLFFTLAIIPVVLLGREFHLRPVEIQVTVGLAAVHPFLLYHAQHVRMYGLLMLCGLTSLWLFHSAIRSGSRAFAGKYAALTLVNIFSVYSHYYGWLLIGLECGYLILWKREHVGRFLLSSAVVLAAFTPWIYWVSRYIYAKGGLGSNLEWIPKPDGAALAWFFADLAGFGDLQAIGKQAVAAIALLVLAAAWPAWVRRRRLHSAHFVYMARFLLFFVLGSVAVAFAASRLMTNSVWGHRHMVYLVFPLLMLVVTAYTRLRSRAVRLTGAVLCAAWACLAIQHHWKGDDKKAPLDSLVIRMLAQERGSQGPVTFYSLDQYLHYPVWFYLETLKAGKTTGFAAKIPAGERGRLAAEAARFEVKNQASVADARGAHFWVGYSSAWQERVTPKTMLEQRGCRTGADVTASDRYRVSTIFPVWCAGRP